MAAPAAVVVIGSVNTDLIVRVPRHPRPGETVLGGPSTTSPGGKGANQALAAARRGARTALVGAVGSDEDAVLALALLHEAGVDLTGVRHLDGGTGLAIITVAADGENAIVVVPGANARVQRDQVDDEVLAAAGVCVLQGEVPAEVVVHAVARCTELGTRVLLNLAPPLALPPGVLRAADPLVVNEHEARAALAQLTDAEVAEAELPGALHAAGVRSVVVTLGARGAVVVDAAGTTAVPAPRVEVRDSTGAGDAFVGALAGQLAAGASLVDAARLAARVGAATVRADGAQPSYPWAGEQLP